MVNALIRRDQILSSLSQATDRLVSLQNSAGFWCGELEGDSILQSEYILLKLREAHAESSTPLMWLASTLYDAALRSMSCPTIMFPTMWHELRTKEEMELAVNPNRGFAHSLSNKCFLTGL